MFHEVAQKDNDDFAFRFVTLVGHLSAMKLADSAIVVRFIREQPYWLSARGNNDE
jgi:hypothetical protein